MDTFCEEVLKYIENETQFEKMIALILRDIFLNDLIYIAYTDKWLKYHISTKQWSSFDHNEFISKIAKINKFLKRKLTKFLNLKRITDIEKYYLNKEITHLCDYIDHYFNEDRFFIECKRYFNLKS